MTHVILNITLLSLLVGVAPLEDAQDANLSPIKSISDVRANPSVFKSATVKKPLVIKSKKQAAKHFSEKALASLRKQVDFEKQVLVVFAWQGSGQDKLSHEVLESFPEQVVFRYKPGRTRDLRRHQQMFALRTNVKWRMAQ